ncbi:hypothetical protein BJX66DRAFT_316003 [Aspergillus keveii]|uniref:GPI anchored protein n=1 Tax=Aspergillus keveii TaxID=714993 RepID=A0ABR4FNP7_9EURO
MITLPAWSLLVTLTAGLLPTNVLAGICDPPDPSYKGWNITNQAQLDALSECTTLDGRLSIWHSYEGPFVLRNVQNLTGSISAFPTNKWPAPRVTSIELPDLLHMTWAWMDMRTLASFSAPKLISAEAIEVYRSAPESTVDLSSLRSVEQSLHLAGDFASIELSSLYNASTLYICNHRCLNTPAWEDPEAPQALDINLPSLEIAGLALGGRISSISAPRLRTISSNGMYLDVLTPIALTFPRLQSIQSGFHITGSVLNLHIPKLQNMTYMNFISWSPNHFRLSAESLVSIDLDGDFASIEMPYLRSYTSIRIKTKDFFDCDGFIKQLNRRAGGDDSEFHCSSPQRRDGPPPMDPHDKAAFAVIGLALVALIVVLLKRKRGNPKPCRYSNGNPGVPDESEVGLLSSAPGDRESDIPLPAYSSNTPSAP